MQVFILVNRAFASLAHVKNFLSKSSLQLSVGARRTACRITCRLGCFIILVTAELDGVLAFDTSLLHACHFLECAILLDKLRQLGAVFRAEYRHFLLGIFCDPLLEAEKCFVNDRLFTKCCVLRKTLLIKLGFECG